MMLLARIGRPLRRRVVTVAVAALVATALAPATWQTAAAHNGKPNGAVLAWGDNSRGQLGDGTTTQHSTPVPVCAPGQTAPCELHLRKVRAIAAGSRHSLALRSDGTVLAWGYNQSGQLGDGTTTQRNTPVPVCAPGQTAPCTSFLDHVIAVSAGDDYSMALRSDGSVLAWGDNTLGQLGDGTTTQHSTPVPVCAPGQTAPCTSFLTHVRAISAGADHAMAVRSNGSVFAWGQNVRGELGDGTTTDRHTPVPVCAPGQTAPCTRFLTHVRAVSAGYFYSMALRFDGTVLAWGDNHSGELGDGTTTDRYTPVPVCAPGQTAPCTRFLTDVRAIAASLDFSLALRSNGAVLSWGDNLHGQLGDGTNSGRSIPGRVCAPGQTAPCTRFLRGVRAIATGNQHSLAVRHNGTALAWGDNAFGQLGDGTSTDRNIPVRVCAPGQTAPCTRFLTHARSVAGGQFHSLALIDG